MQDAKSEHTRHASEPYGRKTQVKWRERQSHVGSVQQTSVRRND